MSSGGTNSTIRFGVFELDLAARQLRKNGTRIKLQDQPFRVLQLFTERPGEVVTREELKEKLWSGDTFVEFDHSLNTCVQKIRQALRDSAEAPRFIETVPRVGYRFVAPVERVVGGPNASRSSLEAPVQGVTAAGAAGTAGSRLQPAALDAPGDLKQQRRRFQIAFAAMAVLLLAAGVGLFAIWLGWRERQEHGVGSVTRLVMSLPDNQKLVTGGSPSAFQLEFSPDGSALVYAAEDSKGTRWLHLRPLDTFESVLLPGTEGATTPFFSPDGQWVGFSAKGAVWKTSIRGGAPQKVFDLEGTLFEARWTDQDEILFATAYTAESGIQRISLNGGDAEYLTLPDKDKAEMGHMMPFLFPGQDELFVAILASDAVRISVVSLPGGKRRLLHEAVDGRHATLLPGGYLVFAEGDGLMASRFDWRTRQLAGPPVPVLDGLYRAGGHPAYGNFALSENGSLAYVPGPAPEYLLVWVDRQGHVQPFTETRDQYWSIALSHDGKQAAVVIRRPAVDRDIWIYDMETTRRIRLTDEGVHRSPRWTPDGERVAFQYDRPGQESIGWRLADGSGETEFLHTSQKRMFPHSWSPDGAHLLYNSPDPETGNDIWILSPGSEPRPLLNSPFGERQPRISPDGRWFAFVSDESGRSEVYIEPFPEGGERQSISTSGGTNPRWSRDGRELFYRNGGKMMSAAIDPGPPLRVGVSRILFDDPTLEAYDLAPGGERFLMVRRLGGAVPNKIHVVVNWVQELNQLVP